MYTAILSGAMKCHGTVARLEKIDIDKFLAEATFKDQ